MNTIYLDYNATTPIAPSVQEAMAPFFSRHYGNPSSHHSLGRACYEAVEDARGQVATLLRADAREIVFTSSGTESNNLALKGAMLAKSPAGGGHLIISALEHPAVVQPARFLERLGYGLSVVGCNRHGTVHPDAVRDALRPDTVLVSIMHANNEIGTVQPIREIAGFCHQAGVLVHTDAAQSVGKISTIVEELDVDLLTIAGHKLYGPKGIGALYVRRGVVLESVLHGADHERGIRAGTENVPYIVGLGQAAVLAAKAVDGLQDRLGGLRDKLQSALCETIGSGLAVHGQQAERLPNTLSVNFPGVSGHELLAQVPEICASTGAACHSDDSAISATLAALGLTPPATRGTVRLTVGWYTSEEEVVTSADRLIGAYESLV